MRRRSRDAPREMGRSVEAFVPFEKTCEVLVAAVLIFGPLALGVIYAWSELIVVAISSVALLLFCLGCLVRDDVRPRLSWAYLPFALFLLVAFFQTRALGEHLLRALSPHTAALREELLSDLGGTKLPGTLSLYPHGTLHMLQVACAAFFLFVVASNVFRRREQVTRLLVVIASVGSAVALLSLFQILSGTDKIYWTIPTGHAAALGGTFVNRNNFCIFMNLSLGAALGLLFAFFERGMRRRYPGRSPATEAWRFITGPRAVAVRYLASGVIIGGAAVFMSLSRGGASGLLAGGAATALVMAARRSRESRGWILWFLGLCVLCGLLYLGFDAVYDRLATLKDKEAYHARLQIVRDIYEAFPRFAVFGTGLGTHRFVYPMFDRGPWPQVAEYAENEYMQVAEEMGLVGLVLVGLFLLALIGVYASVLKRGDTLNRSIAYGTGFSLVAVAIHSVGDFGLHLPGNMCLAACLFGLLVGISRQEKEKGREVPLRLLNRSSWAARRVVGALLAAVVVVVGGWATTGAVRRALAEASWNEALRTEAELAQQDWEGSNETYADLIRAAQQAASYDPGNAEYRYWLAVYRWRAISRVRDPDTGNIIMTPRLLTFVERIVGELYEVCRLCPTYGPAYCMAGQLGLFVLGREESKRLIHRGYRLSHNDPTASFVAGLLDAKEGRTKAALRKFERACELQGSLFAEIADLLVHQIKKPQLALVLAGENPGRLLLLWRLVSRAAPGEPIEAEVRTRAVAALKKACEEEDAPAHLLATLGEFYRKEKDYTKAAACYRRALALRYGTVSWHYALAECLAALKQIGEAVHEARKCLRLMPHFEPARRLIAELAVAEKEKEPERVKEGEAGESAESP